MPAAVSPITIGALSLPGNIFLAPVAGYTDRAFRTLCAEGADFSFTELVSSEALCRGGITVKSILERGGSAPYAVQLFGSDPVTMYRAGLLLEPFHPDAVDINAGCPVHKVVKTGAGCALMRDPSALAAVVRSVKRACEEALGNVPVTVKMRLGWDNERVNYRQCAAAAQEAGASLVTLHPRTRAQMYGGKSDWDAIADLVTRAAVPVAGSGDLFEARDAVRMLEQTKCAAVMFARGALGRPYIFAQTKALLTQTAWEEPPPQQRLALGLRHLEMLAADLGEKSACLEMRKHICCYTKGVPGCATLRNSLVRASTIAEYRSLLEAGCLGHAEKRDLTTN
jgi:nifR3 family TIM-barrel protein